MAYLVLSKNGSVVSKYELTDDKSKLQGAKALVVKSPTKTYYARLAETKPTTVKALKLSKD